jgi:hypothetical protein
MRTGRLSKVILVGAAVALTLLLDLPTRAVAGDDCGEAALALPALETVSPNGIRKITPYASSHGTTAGPPPEFARLLKVGDSTAGSAGSDVPRVQYLRLREADPPFTSGFGLKRLEAYPAGAIDKESDSPLWSWDIPKVLQNSSGSKWARAGRFHAVAFWEILTTPVKKGQEPTLVSVDARTGIRWQREIPLRQTLTEQPVSGGIPTNLSLYLKPSADGERVLAFIPLASATLTFVYDGSGNLLRRLVIPELPLSSVQTKTSGHLFLLDFGTPKGTETYLADYEGRLRAHFTRSKNQGTAASTVSPDGRYAGGGGGDGIYYLFEIPPYGKL